MGAQQVELPLLLADVTVTATKDVDPFCQSGNWDPPKQCTGLMSLFFKTSVFLSLKLH